MKTESLQTGMIMAQDVTAQDGRVLFPAGTRIEAWHLQLIKGLGIPDVEILSGADQRAIDTEEIVDYVREFFLYVDPSLPVNESLFRICVERVGKAVFSGWRLPSLHERRAENVEHLNDIFVKGLGGAEEVARHELDLASFPDIYFKIQAELESPQSSLEKLAALVSRDVGLSGKLLRLVNSPLYSFSTTVDSISRAISLIGLKELSTLALGVTAINYFKNIPPELIDMKTFWRHSISCGIFAKLLAQTQKGFNQERFFTAGLLHDVGRLILFKKMPYASSEAMLFARENTIPLVDAERTVLEFVHTDVSRVLLENWRFPNQLSDIINHHHEPMEAPEPAAAAVIHLADFLANAAGISTGNMYVLPSVRAESWDLLGLSASVLPDLMRDFDAQVDEVVGAFFS